MKIRPSLNWLCAALVMAALAGCAKQDGSMILGQWQAERLDLMGLKLPIGPDMTISRDKLSMQGAELPIDAITQDGDEIVLDTTGGIGLTFHKVDENRIYVQFPLLDRIYYRRTGAAAAARQPEAAPSAVAAARAAETAPMKSAPAPAYAEAYDAALAAAKQGQRDDALRHLHQAVQQGFDRPGQLQHEPGFAVLQSDPRYQVIVLSMAKR